jgi:two-component system response regulator MprA
MRILVAEDEDRLGLVLAQGLSEAQYTVDLARDGEEALAFERAAIYDAIVLDVLLPRLDGLEVCRRLRARGTGTPILFLTARDTVKDRVVGLDSGGDDYLTKPFAFDELLARLRALLRRGAASKEGALRIADLTLDPATQLVRRGERPVELTGREYRILETLMRHPGWVLSRESIIESVWGYDYPDSANLVEIYIGRLRRKLDRDGEPSLIQTVRGSGYRLRRDDA